MKRIYFLLFFGLLLNGLAVAQPSGKTLTQVVKLVIPREGGENAACVVWHPIQKKYYAAMAGNVKFCMAVFDAKGKLLSKPSQETLFDVRGLWYNPATKTLQMNGYDDFGWGEYKLDAKGFPVSVKTLYDDRHQPGEQNVGAFNPKKKLVYFLDEQGYAQGFSLNTGEYESIVNLHLGIKQEDAADEEDEDQAISLPDYNGTSLVFTGIKGQEIGLLNNAARQIELYDEETGYLTRTLALPESAPVSDWLNFAYTNGIYFLFDNKERIWYGYK